MATDDGDDEREHSAGPEDRPGAPDPADAPESDRSNAESTESDTETDHTYVNGGREPATQSRQQSRTADTPVPRRYGSKERAASSNRRYGARPPSGRSPAPGGEPAGGAPRPNGPRTEAPPPEESPPEEPPAEAGRGPPVEEPDEETRTPDEHPRGPEQPRRTSDEQARPPAESVPEDDESAPTERAPPEGAPPKRTQPLREPSEPPTETGERAEGGAEDTGRTESPTDEEDDEVPKYGGLWDPSWGTERGGPASEREQTREIPAPVGGGQTTVDKSGGKYRRR